MSLPTVFSLRLVLLTGFGFFFLSLSLLLYCLINRRKQHMEKQLREEITREYRSLFNEWMAGHRPELAQPNRHHEWIYLLNLWNDLYRDADPDQQDHLIEAANEMDVTDTALKFVEGNDHEYLLSAFQVLGALRCEKSLPAIEKHVNATAPIVHLNAVRTIVMINQKKGLEHIIRDTRDNPDAPITYYIDFCDYIDQEHLCDQLINAIENSSEDEEARLISLFQSVEDSEILPSIRKRLKEADHPEVISGYLQIIRNIGQPDDETLVEPFLRHESEFVRIQAANTLATIGTDTVRQSLLEAMTDESWWVRLRAAQAVVKNPSINGNQLDSIFESLEDPYARDAFNEAMTQ